MTGSKQTKRHPLIRLAAGAAALFLWVGALPATAAASKSEPGANARDLAAAAGSRPAEQRPSADANSPEGSWLLPHAPAGKEKPDYIRALPTAEVIIDVGHGGIDGGTHYEGLLEKDINLAVARKLYHILRKNGIRAVLNRNGDYALSDENRWSGSRSRHQRDLSQRGQLPGEIETHILVSLHVNWTRSKGKRGPLVLHQQQGESVLLAFCIQDALNRQQHTRMLPELGKPFYLLNVVKQPAVIVEMGFISNADDRHMLTDDKGQLQVASAIAAGISSFIMVR